MDPIDPDGAVSRRRLLLAGSGVALGATVLTACGGGSDPASTSQGAGHGSPSGGAGGASGDASSGAGSDGHALATLSDIPVGGAVSATGPGGKPVIVSQPTAGKVAAFSAICTHMGCTVAPQGKILKCPCHGSTYDLATGDNTGGPAPKPLFRVAVKVVGGKVVES